MTATGRSGSVRGERHQAEQFVDRVRRRDRRDLRVVVRGRDLDDVGADDPQARETRGASRAAPGCSGRPPRGCRCRAHGRDPSRPRRSRRRRAGRRRARGSRRRSRRPTGSGSRTRPTIVNPNLASSTRSCGVNSGPRMPRCAQRSDASRPSSMRAAERRAVRVWRAEVRVPRVEVRVEVDQRDRAVAVVDGAEHGQRDGVVAAEHDRDAPRRPSSDRAPASIWTIASSIANGVHAMSPASATC